MAIYHTVLETIISLVYSSVISFVGWHLKLQWTMESVFEANHSLRVWELKGPSPMRSTLGSELP